MANDEGRREEEEPKIVISDMRHARSEEGPVEEPEVQEPVAAEPEPVPAPPAEPVADAEVETPPPPGPQIIDLQEERAKEPAPPAEPPAADAAPEQAEDDSPEMAQVRALFGAGIGVYLSSQLDLLFNFALIYLGRAPNPATGLVAVDLANAKLTIDTLDFMVDKLKDSLPEEQQLSISKVVGELKMLYLNSAGGEVTPPPTGQA